MASSLFGVQRFGNFFCHYTNTLDEHQAADASQQEGEDEENCVSDYLFHFLLRWCRVEFIKPQVEFKFKQWLIKKSKITNA